MASVAGATDSTPRVVHDVPTTYTSKESTMTTENTPFTNTVRPYDEADDTEGHGRPPAMGPDANIRLAQEDVDDTEGHVHRM